MKGGYRPNDVLAIRNAVSSRGCALKLPFDLRKVASKAHGRC